MDSLTFETPPAGGDEDVWCFIALVFLYYWSHSCDETFCVLRHLASHLKAVFVTPVISTSEWNITRIIKAKNRENITAVLHFSSEWGFCDIWDALAVPNVVIRKYYQHTEGWYSRFIFLKKNKIKLIQRIGYILDIYIYFFLPFVLGLRISNIVFLYWDTGFHILGYSSYKTLDRSFMTWLPWLIWSFHFWMSCTFEA